MIGAKSPPFAPMQPIEHGPRTRRENAGGWNWDAVARTKNWPAATKSIFGLRSDAEITRELFENLILPEDLVSFDAAYAAALQPDGPRHFELVYRIRRANDGAQRWIRFSARLALEGEAPGKLIGAIRDITDEIVAQDALEDLARKEADDFREALNEHAIVAITDPRGIITHVNDRFCAISQYSREELLGQDHRIVNSGLHPKEFFQDMWQTIAAGRVWRGELRNRARDGSFYWVDTTIAPFLDASRRPRQYIAIRTDITERKRAEEALRKSEALLAAAIEQMPVAIAVTDARGEFRLKNSRMSRFAKDRVASMDEENCDRWRAIDSDGHPVDRSRYPSARALRGEGEAAIEAIYNEPDGRETWTQVTASPLRDDSGAITGAICVVTDIDQAKRAELALRESEAALSQSKSRLRHAADAARLTYVQFDLARRWVQVAKNFVHVMGYRPRTPPAGGKLEGARSGLIEHVAEADRPAVSAMFDNIFAGGSGNLQYRVIGDDGVERCFEGAWSPEFGPDGSAARVFATILDISPMVEARNALAAAKDKADEILASIADGFYALDANWRFVYCNARAEAVLRKTREEIIGRSFFDVFPVVRDTEVHANYRKVMAEKLPLDFQLISPLLRRWTAFSVYPTREGGISVCFRDISGQKAIEGDLATAKSEAERANLAKSKFLAWASHDLRQPVQSLVLLLSLIERQVATNPKAAATAQMMKQALGGLNGLLTAILDISRLDAGVVEPSIEIVDLGALVTRLGGEYQAKAAEVGLRLRMAPRELFVRTDPALLERALRNLVENAIRYTPSGKILIGMRRRGDHVRIDVIDTGVGVPPEKQAAIFDEFCQLNNPGRDLEQGLGLGLAIVTRLAALLGTKIDMASRAGRGSRFSLSLHLIRFVAPAVSEQLDLDDPGGCILIVEDNAILRHGLETMIREWGYQTLAAASGEQALEFAQAEPGRFAAIVTDYRLSGGLNGRELAWEIARRSGRRIPTLVLTGDTARKSIEEISASGFELLHKPISAERLRRKIAQVLTYPAFP